MEEKLNEKERRRFSDPVPKGVFAILRTLRANGHKAYIVGGSVRDIILRREVSDWDIATSAIPEEVAGLFEHFVDIGIPHGCVRVGGGEEAYYEVTTFRCDGDYSDARRPDRVYFTRKLEDDLARRDFTINAIAYDPIDGVLVDPFSGRIDIEYRIITTVGDPKERFHEDALRPLRAARFAATLEFEIDEETLSAMASEKDRIGLVSKERIRDEIMKMLGASRPSIGFEIMEQTSILSLVIEPLARGIGVTQNEFHAYDVFHHSIYTADSAPVEKPLVRLASLLHDVGKPQTREERNGQSTFYNHEVVGARICDDWMRMMKFSNDEREAVVHLVKCHMFDYKGEWTDGAVRRFIRRAGIENIADLFDLRIADFLGNGLRQGFPSYLDDMRERIERILGQDSALKISHLAINGEDIMRKLGVGPGPLVGRILDELLEVVLDSPWKNTKEELLRIAGQLKLSLEKGNDARRDEP
ncbi:MAG: HDIG domain-containing protein [Candidatus Eisenbacteria bacterium]|nr:HDIG domain-containing protein [Candidatus Eisenbacteria bacterium]